VGGKLRILPAYRRQGLHLRSGLRFFASRQLAHPRTRFYRISIASIFGFTSIASALSEYHLFNPQAADPEGHALAGAFQQLASGSGYQLARDEAVIRVNIFITPETLALYPDAFFEKPAARVYAGINPGYRSNGCYVGFWFRFSRRNLVALVQAVRQLRSRR
ncbi:MAG: hypothetical protein RL685_5502, partial [Pseudomonadota bacterium]